MEVREIIKTWLKENGYDGLYVGGECACEVDDLQPCDEDFSHCEPGYKTKCNDKDCGLCEGTFHIGPTRTGKNE